MNKKRVFFFFPFCLFGGLNNFLTCGQQEEAQSWVCAVWRCDLNMDVQHTLCVDAGCWFRFDSFLRVFLFLRVALPGCWTTWCATIAQSAGGASWPPYWPRRYAVLTSWPVWKTTSYTVWSCWAEVSKGCTKFIFTDGFVWYEGRNALWLDRIFLTHQHVFFQVFWKQTLQINMIKFLYNTDLLFCFFQYYCVLSDTIRGFL